MTPVRLKLAALQSRVKHSTTIRHKWVKLCPDQPALKGTEFEIFAWADLEGGQGIRIPPPGKSQVAIGFLRNIGMDPPREAIGLGPVAS